MTLLRAILHPITFQQLSKSTFTGCQTIEGIQNVYLAINRWKGNYSPVYTQFGNPRHSRVLVQFGFDA